MLDTAPARSGAASVSYRWASARPGRLVDVTAGVLIAVQVVIRAWAGWGGFFSLDDFVFMSRAATQPLSLDFVAHDYNGHLMPAAFLLVWVMTRAAPLDFTAVFLVILLMQAIASTLSYLALRRLFGTRPLVLVLLSVYLFTVLSLPAGLWWAAAINQLPMQIAVASAVLLHVRYLQEGRPRDGLLGVAAVLGGLLFYEKTVLAIPFLFLLTLLFFETGGPLERLWRCLRDHWRVWTAYATLLVGYAAGYLVLVENPPHDPPSAGTVIEMAGTAVGNTIVPAFFGGPWSWADVGFVDSMADPPRAAVWLTWVLALCVFELSMLARRGALRAWFLLATMVAADLALMALGRALIAHDVVAREYRYVTDLAFLAALALGLAFAPPAPVSRSRRRTAHGPPRAAARTLRLLRTPDAAVVLVIGLLLSGLVSVHGFRDRWQDNQARTWVTNAVRGAEAREGADIADSPVSDAVMWSVLAPYNRPSYLLAPVHPYLRHQSPTETLFAFDNDGHVGPAYVQPGVTNWPGPAGDCGYKVTSGRSVTIPLTGKLFSWSWTVRVGYFTNRAGWATVRAGRTTEWVAITPGLNQVFLDVEGDPDRVVVSRLSKGVVVCVTEVTVGNARGWPSGLKGGSP